MVEPTTFPTMPFERPGVLGIAPLLRVLQEREPITRIRTPVGDEAWLVTRYDEVKQLYDDGRLGRSHPDPRRAPGVTNDALIGRPSGNFDTEPTDHAQMRALLTPFFTARRMRAIRPRVEALTEELLDALAAQTPPADLCDALAVPLPVLVICELLGVPVPERQQVRAWSQETAGLEDPRRAQAAHVALIGYMAELAARKRAHPEDDVISGFCAAAEGVLSDAEVARLSAGLLFAGHETTVVRLELGTALLLTNPEEWQALRDDPARLNTTVEEVLRTTLIGGAGMTRWAREDVPFSGVTIRAGDAVILDIGTANHDPRVFADADRFDTTRRPNPHIGFGHAGWFCIGAPLARMEMQVAFAALARRFPTLRLAVPVEELKSRDDLLTGGLAELPVAW